MYSKGENHYVRPSYFQLFSHLIIKIYIYVYKYVYLSTSVLYLPMTPFKIKLIIDLDIKKSTVKQNVLLNYFGISVFEFSLFIKHLSNIYYVWENRIPVWTTVEK